MLRLAWLVVLFPFLAPAVATAQGQFQLEDHESNAMLGHWHDELHLERDQLRNTLPGPDLAGPGATLILTGVVGLTGGITALMSIEGAPRGLQEVTLVILGIAGGLLVFGIGWLIERFAARAGTEAYQRYQTNRRALGEVHRSMRRRGLPFAR
ncbi:MAG: hypothetical protein H6719_24500 [Sandaracinaceae bacterium]|nr:hypothetical protein [Sandaracinaceae bacterium]